MASLGVKYLYFQALIPPFGNASSSRTWIGNGLWVSWTTSPVGQLLSFLHFFIQKCPETLARRFVKDFACKQGSCIAIYMNKCAEYVFAYIACLKAGWSALLMWNEFKYKRK
jgi:hypothetical protein